MRILVDENVESAVIVRLRLDGHAVDAVADSTPSEDDLPILARAVAYDVLLLTADLDFGSYICRDKRPAPRAGVVLYRLGELSMQRKADVVGDAFALYSQRFTGHFTVIEETGVRFRPLP
jgi:predicted nuclease of predicted toxin-antitoxin system